MLTPDILVKETINSRDLRIAELITGHCKDKIETEELPYYIEAGNDISQLPLNLMLLETCVDVDRISDLLLLIPQSDKTYVNIVIDRMIKRFGQLKPIYPEYWRTFIYYEYVDFFRRFISKPSILNFDRVSQLQVITEGQFIGVPDISCWRLLIYRCNQHTLNRMLGLPMSSNLYYIELAIAELQSVGIEAYYNKLHKQNQQRLAKIKSINHKDLYHTDFYEYHPEDLVMTDGYIFAGPEFSSLLTSESNPYTRQPLTESFLDMIKSKIPQPKETPKELCVKYLA